ncbi:MAG: dihydrofolate reductase [Alphaproteobacteria bacterium]
MAEPKAQPQLVIIAAVAGNRVIGRSGQLPWRIKSDMAHFRQTTMGSPVIMGRRTFQTLRSPLAGRTNVVVTRDKTFKADGVLIADSLDAAIELAQDIAQDESGSQGNREINVPDIFVIGGGELYQQALARSDRLCITHVELDGDDARDGDVLFPEIDWSRWDKIASKPLDRTDGDDARGTVAIYARRRSVL